MIFLDKIFSFYIMKKISSNLEDKVEYLNRADEREASEEPHGSSYGWQLVFCLICSILAIKVSIEVYIKYNKQFFFLGNSTKSGGFEVNPNKLKWNVEFEIWLMWKSINQNLFLFLVLVSATAQCFVEEKLRVVWALVVPVLLQQSFIFLLVRLHFSGSIRVHDRDPQDTPYASQKYNWNSLRALR